MSAKKTPKKRPPPPDAGIETDADPEGWESMAEESEGTLATSPELEEALREAAAAVDGSGGVSETARSDAPEVTEPPEVTESTQPTDREAEDAHGEVPHPEPEVGAEDESLEEVQAALKLAQDRLVRLQADFENFRRRALKERTEGRQYGHQNLVKDLLSTVDNLERAMEHARGASASEGLGSLLQGVEMVQRELSAVMSKHGVREVETEGKLFDPAIHEAMAQFQDDSVPANTVVEVLEKGYQLRSRLIRPARVIVSVSSPADTDEKSEDETTD